MPRTTPADRLALDTRRVERIYSLMARFYDDVFDWALGPGRRKAVSDVGIEPGDAVLEVGIGTGLTLPLYPEYCSVTGIDLSEAMLNIARERADSLGKDRIRLQQMDAGSLRFPDRSFDRILAPYVMSVVPDPGTVMAEIARVCRPGGAVAVVNHFLSRNPVVGALEKVLTPLSRQVGFDLDLRRETVLITAGLTLVRERRVNPLGSGSLLLLKRDAADSPVSDPSPAQS